MTAHGIAFHSLNFYLNMHTKKTSTENTGKKCPESAVHIFCIQAIKNEIKVEYTFLLFENVNNKVQEEE